MVQVELSIVDAFHNVAVQLNNDNIPIFKSIMNGKTMLPSPAIAGLISSSLEATPFASESDLMDTVLRHIEHFLQHEHVQIATEVQVGSGYVDLIAARVTDKALDRLSHAISGVEACLLANMHYRQRLRLSTIAKRCCISVQKAEAAIHNLSTMGYVHSVGSCYVRNAPFVTDIVAVEGKLRNWRRALSQAHRNRLFTSQTYVALDARYARPALANLDVFHHYRVGLAIIFQSGDVHVVYRPPKGRPIANVMPIIAENALLQQLN